MNPLAHPKTQAPVDVPAVLSGHDRVVAMGASAGGLHALSVILAALPADFPAPILVVQHLSPDFPSHLAHILSRHTSLHVKQAEQGDRLRAGWVYVAAPGKHLLACGDGSLALTTTPRVHHCRPSADVLFKSVAAGFGTRSVGVILTGGDGDGAAGIQAVKVAGGVTFAQDLPSSQQPSMPRSAAATGDVDFVLPLADIAAALVALTGSRGGPDLGKNGSSRSGSVGRKQPVTVDHAGRDKITEQVWARRARVAAFLAGAGETPPAPGFLEAVAELASCAEALGVAEEALRVQSDVITSYRLALRAEAAGP